MKRIFLRSAGAFLIILASFLFGYANPGHTARTFNVRDGLPSNSVSTVVQDGNGLVWIGTWNGLSFYDGYRFYTFRSGEGTGELSTNRILEVHPDSAANAWFITYDYRLNLLDNSEGRFHSLSDLMPGDSLASSFDARFFMQGKNGVWVRSRDGATVAIIRRNTESPLGYDVQLSSIGEIVDGARRLRSIKADAIGNSWIITDNSALLEGSTPQVSIAGPIADVAAVGPVSYVMGTDGTLTAFAEGRLRPVTPLDDFGTVSALEPIDDTRLVAATDRGYAIYNSRTNRWATAPISGGVEMVKADSKNRVWALGTNGKVYMSAGDGISPRPVEIQTPPGSRNTEFVTPMILEDNYGTIWLAPKQGILCYYNEETGRAVPSRIVSPLLKYTTLPEVEKYFVDSNKNLWVISAHGLSLVNFTYQNYRNLPIDENHETRSMIVLADGSLLAGSSNGVIAKYNPQGRFEGYLVRSQETNGDGQASLSATPRRFSIKVYSLYQDPSGGIWIGTKGDGLFNINTEGRVRHYTRSGVPGRRIECDTVYDFDTDSRGQLWTATYGRGPQLARPRSDGSFEFVSLPTVAQNYPEEDGYLYVRRITHNGRGEVALATNSGLVAFRDSFASPTEIRFVTSVPGTGDRASLRTSNVMQVLVGADGNTLVSSMGGEVQRVVNRNLTDSLLRFEPPAEPALSKVLSNGNVLSMVQDRNGNYYFVRETDIVAYFPHDSNITILGRSILGDEHEFSEALPAVGADGSLYFGAVGYVVKVDPVEVAKEPYAPNIVLTGIQLQGEPKEKFIVNPTNIILEPDHRNFALSFTALDYSGSGRTQYAYRFEPDSAWTQLGTSNVLQVTELKPGVHRLYIKSTNVDGTWVDNAKYVDIMVKPTFSETIWAKLLILLSVLAVIFVGIWFYNIYRRNKLMNQLRRRERDFYINASHRLRTPLALIGSPVYEVLKAENLSETGREHLERVRRSAKNMLQVLNTMLEAEFKPSGLFDSRTDPTVPDEVEPGDRPSYMTSDNWLEVKDPDEVPTKKDITILIVEDNDDLRGFLRDILAPQYTVLTAANGREGLEIAESGQPDFILTDVMMPEMDGLTMVKKIKSQKQLSHIPIIVLSAKTSMADRMEGLRAGIDDYISKPFSATLLRQRIANIIAQRKMLQQSYMEMIGKQLNKPEGTSNAADTAADTAETGPSPEKREYRLETPQIIEADQVMMEKLMKFLEERIGDENLRIEEMADAVSMGRTVFYGKIKAIVGMSPSDFLRTLRMQRAEDLMVNSKLNFSQIAFSVGFSDPKYFTKCFKKETGMTPSEYRKQKRAEL